jgi:hypothetical protein
MTLPKAKATQAELDAANGGQLDPIIDAMLEHLPAPGDYWSKDDRALWLRMIELAFELVYDDTEQPQATDEPSTMRAHGG